MIPSDPNGAQPAEGAPEKPLPVIRSAGIALLGSALGGALAIGNEMLAARYLGVQDYGLYASGMTMARIGEAIAVFGLPVAIFHYVPIHRRRLERDRLAGTVYAAGLLPLVLGTAIGLAIWLLAPWLERSVFHGDGTSTYIRLLAVAVPLMAATEVLGSLTRGFGFAKYYVLVRNLVPPLAFLGAIAAIIGLAAPHAWFAGGMVAAYGLAALVGVACVARVAAPEIRGASPRLEPAALYGYASGVMVNSLLYLAFAMTGTFIVALFLGSDHVGIYRICLQVVIPFDMVLLAFHAAMGPIYPVLAREGRTAELEAAYGTAARGMVMLLTPLGIFLAWNRLEILALLGSGFAEGSGALLLMAIGYGTFTAFGTIAYLLMLSDRRAIETRNAAAATVLNAVLGVLLVPSYGLTGAGGAAALSFGLLNAMRIAEAKRVVGLRTFTPGFLRVALVCVGAPLLALGALRLAGFAQGGGIGPMAVRAAVTGLALAPALWRYGLDAAERRAAAAWARRALGRDAAENG